METKQFSELELTLRVVEGVKDFSADEWASLHGTNPADPHYNPFISYSYLSALENSGCVGHKTGWYLCYLRLETKNGELLGVVPNYLKSHSQGEYVFDHGWADAFERAGAHYYPKLQATIPFTPATGPRLLVSRNQPKEAIQKALASGIRELCMQQNLSSAHITFATKQEVNIAETHDFLMRNDIQFHFKNNNLNNYDDFLNQLTSRKRNALRKERRIAVSDGITIEWLTGAQLTETIWDSFFEFYMNTADRKWGRPYLNREFFSLIGSAMADQILLVMAKRDHRYIAGAINFIGADTLYGRHWGSIEHHPNLHFEICYHQAIEFAIANRLKTVEAGAQGDHKIARGYQPVYTYSAHYISNPSFRSAVADYLQAERRQVKHLHRELSAQLPFRKTINSDSYR